MRRARETNSKFNSSRKQDSIIPILNVTIPLAFRMVFGHYLYIAIAGGVFVIFWILFNLFDQLLFFSPVLTFYLPGDAVTGFIITNITSALMGILVAMNVYVVVNTNVRLDKSLISGSILGIASSTCASCSSIGSLLISALGGFGIVATDFLTNYQTPLRLVSIAILLWALYSIHNKITKPCILNDKYPKNKDYDKRNNKKHKIDRGFLNCDRD